jgi:hypothetical protein
MKMYNLGDEDPELSQPGCINKCRIMMTETTRNRIEANYAVYNEADNLEPHVIAKRDKEDEVADMIRR